MTRRQKKHELFVTYHYHNGNLRRKPKVRGYQIFSNFLQAIKNALPISTK